MIITVGFYGILSSNKCSIVSIRDFKNKKSLNDHRILKGIVYFRKFVGFYAHIEPDLKFFSPQVFLEKYALTY